MHHPNPFQTASFHPRKNKRTSLTALMAACGWLGFQAHAQELPQAVDREIDFTADILPILQESCFQCHGAEKPKGGYRLTTREYALAEGDYGVNIIVGNSEESPLIQFVAHLEEDSEMPPIGKGDKLSDSQIALLRAWIDQGLPFEDISEASFYFSVTPQFRYFAVDGNEAAFREHTWMRDGFNGGLHDFEWRQTLEDGRSFSGRGRVTAPNDRFFIEAEIAKRDLGFFRFGFDQARTYDDAHGGWSPGLGLGPWALDRDLYTDLKRAWFEIGLDQPERPKVTLGYEYRAWDGAKSMLQWGTAFDAAFNGHSIYPAWKSIDQESHTIRLDADHTWKGFRIQDEFRGVFYSQDNTLETADSITAGNNLPDSISTQQDDYHHFQGSNALSVEKRLKPWWLASGGYYYSHLGGEANLAFGNFDPSQPAAAALPLASRGIDLRNETQVLSVNSLFGPWKNWTAHTGIQSEWARRKGTGNTTFFGAPTVLGSNMDRHQVEEQLGIRYAGLPYSVAYADLRFQQESIGLNENAFINDGWDSKEDFMRNTDARGRHGDLTLGLNTSPWKSWTFHPSYRYKQRQHDFNHLVDTDLSPEPGNGYPGAILERETEGQQWKLNVSWKPVSWFKSSVEYEGEMMDYTTRTGSVSLFGTPFPGGSLLAGNYDSHHYRLTTTLSPSQRWFWTSSIGYTDSRIVSGIQDSNILAPYDGDLITFFTSWTYLYSATTTLLANYSFSQADYGQSLPLGLPLGSEFDYHMLQCKLQKRLTDTDTLGVQYAYYRYRDDLLNGFLDYDAHGVFLTWTKVFK